MSSDYEEIDNFANFRRNPKFRARLPRSLKIRNNKKRKNKWYRQKRKWRKKYNEYLRSPEWKAKREERLKICNNICEYCGKAPAAHVHHLTYERIYNETMDDLRGICLDCHEREHPGKKFKKFAVKSKRKKRKGPENQGTEEVDF